MCYFGMRFKVHCKMMMTCFGMGTVFVRETAGTREPDTVHCCSADSEVKSSHFAFPRFHMFVFAIFWFLRLLEFLWVSVSCDC